MSEDRDGRVVIVGCGRVGAGLAARLVDHGHAVVVVDSNPSAFGRLRELPVERIEGIGFDRTTLVRAGVEDAVGVAAVTNGDNTNIVVARTAREAFGVQRVVARIFDVRRAAIYERLGIPTIASAQLTIEMAMRHLHPDDAHVCWLDPSARIGLHERSASAGLVGRTTSEIEAGGVLRLVAVRRLGAGILVTADLVVQEGDVLYVAVDQERMRDAVGLLDGTEGDPP